MLANFNHHFAFGAAAFHVFQRLLGIGKGKGAVDDWHDFTGLHQRADLAQLCAAGLHKQKAVFGLMAAGLAGDLGRGR